MVRADHEFCGPMIRNTIWDKILHLKMDPVRTCRAKYAAVGSTGQRKGFVEPIRGCCITKCFPWARIELQRNLVQVVLTEG
jgi:hypothetical protein